MDRGTYTMEHGPVGMAVRYTHQSNQKYSVYPSKMLVDLECNACNSWIEAATACVNISYKSYENV